MLPNRASPPNFTLVFPKLPSHTGMTETKDILLHLYETVLPGFDINANDVNWMGTVVRRDHTQAFNFNTWTFSFTIDNNFLNWRTLYEWARYAVDTKPIPKDHSIEAILSVTDNYKQTIMNVRFTNVWLRNMGDVQLTYREGEMMLDCTATLEFGKYEISVPQ
jgi:hypothetical protein